MDPPAEVKTRRSLLNNTLRISPVFPGVRGVYHIYQSLIIDSAYLFAV
jgi:hypothetical protein